MDISEQTIHRQLQIAGIQKAVERRLLTEMQAKKRLEWAKVHKSWTADDWHNLLYGLMKVQYGRIVIHRQCGF